MVQLQQRLSVVQLVLQQQCWVVALVGGLARRQECRLPYVLFAWTIPAIDLNIISEKIEEFPPHFPVATSSMQHAWEGGLMR